MARKKRKKVASRGSVNNIILKTLVNGDKYGYEIIKEVEEYSDGKIVLKQPSLYSSLSRFEEKQFVSSYWGDSDIGGRRHYYHLTDLGLEYYKKNVLKEEFDEEDELENTNNSTTLHQEESITINEVDENEIPAIVDFEPKDNKQSDIIPDHNFQFNKPTNEKVSNNIKLTSLPKFEEVFNNFREKTKKTNNRFKGSILTKLYLKKRKIQTMVLDKDGIYKLRDSDYTPINKKHEPVIIDNVIKRTKTSDEIFGYTTYTSNIINKSIKQNTSSVELTDEEKQEKNEKFLNKINLLALSRMKKNTSDEPKEESKKKEYPPIDYRSKLNAIIDSNNLFIQDEDLEDDNDSLDENNLFNYIDQDKWNTPDEPNDSDNEENEDDESDFIELESEEQYDLKPNINEYIKEINTYSTPANQVKMSRYDNLTKAVLVDKTFLLNNKLNMVFGIILSLIMLFELVICNIIFGKLDLIFNFDKYLLITAYVFIGIFLISCLVPYFVERNNHKANNFKFKYSLWFGILTFVICVILIYCFNALAGFEIDNFKYFAVKLIVPTVLSLNFIIAPVIYSILIKKKSFYD